MAEEKETISTSRILVSIQSIQQTSLQYICLQYSDLDTIIIHIIGQRISHTIIHEL